MGDIKRKATDEELALAYDSKYAIDIVDRLELVNHYVGNTEVIRTCHDAANYISILRYELEKTKTIKAPDTKSGDKAPSYVEYEDIMEAMFGTERFATFCYLSAVKYIWDFKSSKDKKDLEKAREYLKRAYRSVEDAKADKRLDYDIDDYEFIDWSYEIYLRIDHLIAVTGAKSGIIGV